MQLTPRTPRYCGHPAYVDKSQPPGETHREMTETNSCYYRLSLLRKCGHFRAPKRNISLFFLSLWQILEYTSSKILTHITWRITRHYNKGKNDTKCYRPLLCERVKKWLLYSILGRKDIAIRAYKHFVLWSLLCSISAIKELPKTIKNNIFDSKLTF